MSSRNAFPRRATLIESPVTDTKEPNSNWQTPVQAKQFGARTGISVLLSSQPRSDTATSAPRPKYSSPRTRELSPTRTQSSVQDRSPVRPVFPSRRARQPSPVRSILSLDAARERRTRDTSEPRPSRSRQPSSAGGEMSRTKLWLELRNVHTKSLPPTERSRSREPP